MAFKYAVENDFDYVILLHGDDQGDISNILPYLKNKEYENYEWIFAREDGGKWELSNWGYE